MPMTDQPSPCAAALERQLSSVSATAFITLFARAAETQTAQPILRDPQAVAIAEQLRPLLAQSERDLCRRLAAGRMEPMVVVTMAQRARRYDAYVRDFCVRRPDAAIVSLGCGLDTRFSRVDDGRLLFYDLDLPAMIDLKRTLLAEGARYQFIASSVLDFTWMDRLPAGGRACLFLAEGLFMYLMPAEVKNLVLELARCFPGCELVCEVFNNRWLRPPWKALVDRRMQGRLGFSADSVFRSGVDSERHFEPWAPAIQFLDDWSYFDDDEPKLRRYHWYRHVPLLRKTQWTLHYRLGNSG